MDAISTLTKDHGTSIPSILLKTFAIYQPLLTTNQASILSTPRTTYPYGPHVRQKLDVYLPSTSSSPEANINKADKSPILIFLYGGGRTFFSS
jgi:acetyl esterase/lipase